MKSNSEVAAESIRRANTMIRERQIRKSSYLHAGAVMASLVLIVALAWAIPKEVYLSNSTQATSHTLGALFVSNGVLGYIVVGVLAFVLGVCVALLGSWLRNREGKGRP